MMKPFDSENPYEAALKEYLQLMMLFLGGVLDLTSTQQYSEHRSLIDPDLGVCLDISVLPYIAQLIEGAGSFLNTS